MANRDTPPHFDEESEPLLNAHKRGGKKKVLILTAAAGLSLILIFFFCLVAGNHKDEGFKGRMVMGTHGGVAVEAEECSNVGVQILKQGGNAVDSAIASALCIGVISNHATGIGGGGFMLIRSPNGTFDVIDFREQAPAKAHEDMFTHDPMLAQIGALAVATPGEIRGFELAHQRHGQLEWHELFEPAIRIARDGFITTSFMESRLKLAEEWIMESQAWMDIYAPNGTLAREGDLIRRPALATTLETIANEGPDAFYKGPLAESMIRTIQENDGILTMEDLSAYKAILRPSAHTYYHGRKITTATSPSSGPVLLAMLNILESYNLYAQGETALSTHRMLEAFKYGYAFRTEMGDPAYVHNQARMDEIISKDWASCVRQNLSDERTFPPPYYQPKFDHVEAHGTMHLSVVDDVDGAVALTSTMNLLFGSRLMDPTTGVIFNDQMDDFSIPGTPNKFGLYPSKNNYVAPGKRPLSSITPAMVEHDKALELVVGGSGGSLIPTSVMGVLLNVLDYNKDLYTATESPRIHHQLVPNVVVMEDDTNVRLMQTLNDRGHQTFALPPELHVSAVQSVQRFPDGQIGAVSDPRKNGLAAAY